MFEVRRLHDNRYVIGIVGETEESIKNLTKTAVANRKHRLKGIFGKTVFDNEVEASVTLTRIEAFRFIHSVLLDKGMLKAANAISSIARVSSVPEPEEKEDVYYLCEK